MAGSKKRSLAKTVTYFISDSALTGAVSFAVTTDVSTSLRIACGVQVMEIALYYFHERVWERLHLKKV